MLKDFFIPTPTNHYYPIGLRPRFLYTYVVFMLIFNLFAARFLAYFPSPVHAQATYTPTDIITLTNQDRVSSGLQPLNTNSELMSAAAAKAADMFKYQYWAHYNPVTGASPWDFIAAAGYNYHYAGENLAEGYDTADAVNTAWLNSSEHRANIMDTNYQDIGVAVEYGSLLGANVILVVQMFGSTQPAFVNITPYPTPTPAPIQKIVTTPVPKPKLAPQAVAFVQPTSTPVPTTPIPTPTPSLIVPTQTITITATPLLTPTMVQNTHKAQPTANVVTTAISTIETHVLGMKFATGINLFVSLFLITLFSLDAIYYYRVRNIQTRMKASSIAHIPLLTILAIICLMGTIGVTL